MGYGIRKPGRSMDIYDLFYRDEKKKTEEKDVCPYCGGKVSRESKYSKYFACEKCGRRIR